jgi:Flp pilus assembly protein TadD
VADKAVEAAGDDYNTYIPFANIVERMGQHEEAMRLRELQLRALERHIERVPEDVRARILTATMYAGSGREAEAIRAVEMALVLRPNDPNIQYNAACAYGILQKKAEALALLRKAKQSGFSTMEWAARDPDLTCLYDDPEFKSIVGTPREAS